MAGVIKWIINPKTYNNGGYIMEKLETINYRGYDINIYPDDCWESPREWDNLGQMICFHRNYDLGDKHDYSIEEVKEITKRNDVVCLPLYLYDHSGITMNTSGFSCQWDSGQVGIIFVDYAAIRKEYGVKNITKKMVLKVRNILIQEVKTYDDFLNGTVYGFMTEKDGEDIDSCWGFYGYPWDYMLGEAKNGIDADIEIERKKKQAKTKAFVKHGVPLEKRCFV